MNGTASERCCNCGATELVLRHTVGVFYDPECRKYKVSGQWKLPRSVPVKTAKWQILLCPKCLELFHRRTVWDDLTTVFVMLPFAIIGVVAALGTKVIIFMVFAPIMLIGVLIMLASNVARLIPLARRKTDQESFLLGFNKNHVAWAVASHVIKLQRAPSQGDQFFGSTFSLPVRDQQVKSQHDTSQPTSAGDVANSAAPEK